MKMKQILSVIASLILFIVISGCNTDDALSSNEPDSLLKYGNGNIGSYDLSQEEIDGLIYMRIEEKLARDVYI